MKTKIFLLLTAWLSLLLSVSAEVVTGTDGETITWSLDRETGVLTINGTGATTNDRPWQECKEEVKEIIVGEGITELSSSAFYGMSMVSTIKLPTTLTAIGYSAFDNCTSLKTVYLPSSITTATNSSLTSTSSSYYTFYNCTSLEDVQLGQNWNMSLRLNVSNNIAVESMIAMFNSLKDLTGDTAKTLTLGEINLAKLTDEQKAIATNKNWTLA